MRMFRIKNFGIIHGKDKAELNASPMWVGEVPHEPIQ